MYSKSPESSKGRAAMKSRHRRVEEQGGSADAEDIMMAMPPPIYSVPTTDTLGDESSLVFRPYTVPTPNSSGHGSSSTGRFPPYGYKPQHQQSHAQQQSQPQSLPQQSYQQSHQYAHRHVTPTRSNKIPSTPPRTRPGVPTSSTFASPSRSAGNAPPPAASSRRSPNRNHYYNQKKKRSKRSNATLRDFQHEEDFMTVSVQTVPVAQRSAFEIRPAMPVEEWQRWATSSSMNRSTGTSGNSSHANAEGGGGTITTLTTSNVDGKMNTTTTTTTISSASSTASASSSSNNASKIKRMSPSLQHLELLHTVQAMSVVRQVKFSPSTSLASDMLLEEENDINNNDNDNPKNKRDGRYRSIDPVKASSALFASSSNNNNDLNKTLPPPQLSNKKVRLPTRADVGFPHASRLEIEAKQLEISHEVAWEEASPRLVVLVTSDDLGRAVEDAQQQGGETAEQQRQQQPESENENIIIITDDAGSTGSTGTSNSTTKAVSLLKREHALWNGGGLRGMPFCGPEIMRAKARNARHFGRQQQLLGNSNTILNNNKKMRPNPYSVLAPPLDAMYSPSKGWRPRPFHDRPAGRKYGLACPLSVRFAAGNIEPLVCSLALYTLPISLITSTSSSSSSSTRSIIRHQAFGKMSEEFWFPAGDWEGKVSLEAARREDGSMDEEILQSWIGRKHKAIFSYDPLALVNDGTSDGRDTVFVVLQVYRMAHQAAGGVETYQQQQSSKGSTKPKTTETGDVRAGADRVFQQFGTQLLAPLCFGFAKFYNDNGAENKMKWPQGETRGVKLFAYPPNPESQEAFVMRLATTAQHEYLSSHQNQEALLQQQQQQQQHSDDKSTVSASSETTRKMRGVSRLFKKTTKLPSHQQDVQHPMPSTQSESSPLIDGEAKIFVSSLTVDFLQALLASPTEWGERDVTDVLPRLLVDVSGDLAVLLDSGPPVQASSTGSPLRKRSNLLRLPVPDQPAGYVTASEFREVHYLPARPEKHYDVDSEISYRSLLNLLYLYPRLLRPAGGNEISDQMLFTIRVQVLQSKSSVDEESGRIESSTVRLSAFHNPSPWAGPALVDVIYTKTFGGYSGNGEQSLSLDLKNGIPIKDEIKLRLPDVLDGTFTVHISLFSVEPVDQDMSLRPVAEAMIPLSSSSSRDSNGRIATIIPNGNHRLKLGDFQLQLETRLVSSIHIGDPAVAAVLRDFPYAKEREESGRKIKPGYPLPPSGNTSNWLDSNGDIGDSFSLILSDASASTVAVHFDILLYMHLCNLVNVHEKSSRETNRVAKMMMENMQSLFEVFRKIKEKFVKSSADNCQEQLQSFLKKHLDLFEEGFLSRISSPSQTQSDLTDGEADGGSESLQDPSVSQDDDIEDVVLDDEHEGAVRIRSKSDRPSQHELRVSRTAATLGRSGVPFSRVAYGASKMDRMRLEAEIHKEGPQSLVHFFDDDETIATLATAATLPMPLEMQPSGNDAETLRIAGIAQGGLAAVDAASDNSILRSATASTDTRRSTGSGSEFAQRVRTAAQVMLAPCVGPSLTNILVKPSSPQAVVMRDEKKADDTPQEHTTETSAKGPAFQCLPGSDIEEEDCLAAQDSFDASFVHLGLGATFRGPPDGPMLLFSVKSNSSHEVPVSSGDYVYESIMVLWLRAWLDHVEGSLTEPLDTSSLTGRQFATFPIPKYDVSRTPPASIFSYYAHLDILLPLCLKSIVLRYSIEVLPVYSPATRVLVDDRHMIVLEPFTELLARGLMGQAVAGLGSQEGRDLSLLRALSSSEHVLDFLVGLLGVLHSEHVHSLLRKFFRTLKDCETEHLGDSFSDFEFEWTEESLHRVRSSRQLRLRAVDTLAVLPSFVALNYPPKYVSRKSPARAKKPTWKQQYIETDEDPLMPGGRRPYYPDRIERLPPCGWLSDLVISEGLSVCTLSCEAVVAEAMAHIEVSTNDNTKAPSSMAPSLKKRPGAALTRADLLSFQSLAIHAITSVYELILRRHAMDRRFQKDSSRERIAGLFAVPILDKSISSSRWLARMESTHKVRSMWLLCFIYVLQEAPDPMVRDYVRSLCNPKDVRIHRFIRLLRLCSSTFQSFVDLPRHTLFPSEIDKVMSPWLLQESFNTVCAATNIVVEECVTPTSTYPHEQEKMMTGILDLLLHLLTTPQSSVTHLRAVGGALQALEQFGVALFLDITGTNLQHWIRVILSLMNSTSLSVRSISVDFVVSLVGSIYEHYGSIDLISLIAVSVLPEVAAREIALYSVSGHISTADDMARSLWPLRRSIADLEDTNPLDDDRVDPQLVPILSVFCRTCQAIMDGVLIEMRLRGDSATVVGTNVAYPADFDATFDADEESLFEAATFFVPETAPMQRIRWLLTLMSLHESKGQWVEAAETLYLCARTITDSIPHLKNVWRPSRFILWSDSKRSLWLDTVGEEMGRPDRGNAQVMHFADDFLEPANILGTSWKASASGKLLQPTVPTMSVMLGQVAKDAVKLYLREEGMDELAHIRLESLLKAVMHVLDAHSSASLSRGGLLSWGVTARKKHIEDEAALRTVLSCISGDMTKLAERMLLLVQNEPSASEGSGFSPPTDAKKRIASRPQYVVVQLSGKKPPRFEESTALPTFLEFDTPCICRLPASLLQKRDSSVSTQKLCLEFAQPLVSALQKQCSKESVVLLTEPPLEPVKNDDSRTYLYVFPVDTTATAETRKTSSVLSKSIFFRKGTVLPERLTLVEMKVAHVFPCALSRQRSLLTTELSSPWKG